MLDLKTLQKDINELPEEAQTLLADFIDLLKKRYSTAKKQEINPNQSHNQQRSNLEILRDADLVSCISSEPGLSSDYKSVIQQDLDSKYDNR